MWFRRKPTVTQEQIRELTKSVTNLREDIDDLFHRHERLRGKFYGSRGKPQDSGAGDPRETTDGVHAATTNGASASNTPNNRLTKHELLARYFTPGRPTIHRG